MNKEKIVENMISYIEEEEKALQASKMTSDNKQIKTDIVNKILDKLEKELENEN